MEKKYILRKGDRGGLVKVLQGLLGITADGEFGKNTHKAVIAFQGEHCLDQDGIVGPLTWRWLDYNPEEFYADTDVSTSASWIERYPLPEGEYVKRETKKEWIFLHHTAGRENPYKTIDGWANDQRGRIGTHYVIGGIPCGLDVTNIESMRLPYDGKILQAIPDAYYGYHLGPTKSSKMHRGSISIEVCSAGYLKEKGGKFYTWFGSEVHPSQVAKLNKPFRGYRYYHKYSQAQLNSLEALLYLIGDKHGIDLSAGIPHFLTQTTDIASTFDYNADVDHGRVKGILSHTNVRKDKSDIAPQKGMVKLLQSFSPTR